MSNLTTHQNSQPSELLDDDDFLREELERLAAAQAELLEPVREHEAGDVDEVTVLRAENAELRARLEEFDQAWGERQREYENLLEEKSEVIRSLHQKIQQMQEGGGSVSESADADDLTQMRRQLEEERRQIQEDEEALMVQMRQMEMAMSRERAELARHRTELQRLQIDVNREIDKAARDSGLRDRLQALRKPHEQPTVPAEGTRSVSTPTPPPKKQSSGLLRRLFG